jgi:hypothetical protein
MPENQGHGKTWEKDLGINVYKATEEEVNSVPRTAPIDVPRGFNRLEGVDVSIKVSGKDTIDMGDILRVYDEVSSGEKIHMTVVHWQQKDPSTKKIKSITEVDLTNSANILFGSVSREQLVILDTTTKTAGKVRPDVTVQEREQNIKSVYAMRDELHKTSGFMHYHLMFYRNTKTPSRVQGQFTHFSQFVKENPERVIAVSETGEFRGGRIAEEIASTKRNRKKQESHSTPH